MKQLGLISSSVLGGLLHHFIDCFLLIRIIQLRIPYSWYLFLKLAIYQRTLRRLGEEYSLILPSNQLQYGDLGRSCRLWPSKSRQSAPWGPHRFLCVNCILLRKHLSCMLITSCIDKLLEGATIGSGDLYAILERIFSSYRDLMSHSLLACFTRFAQPSWERVAPGAHFCCTTPFIHTVCRNWQNVSDQPRLNHRYCD